MLGTARGAWGHMREPGPSAARETAAHPIPEGWSLRAEENVAVRLRVADSDSVRWD